MARIKSDMKKKSTRKKVVRYGFVATNVAILVIVSAFVLIKPESGDITSTSMLRSATTTEATTANPLDQVSSADIALVVARMNSLPESTAIKSQADSQAITAASAAASSSVVSKPQVVTAGLKSNADILVYKTVVGDTVVTLGQKFGVTSDSIRQSNSLISDSLAAGTTLRIPPVNGLVYLVKAGDTPEILAQKYSSSTEKIVVFNDAEISGLKVGSYIVIPDGVKPAPVTASQIASSASALPWGGSPVYGHNGYDYGYCTWYVANKISVPANWGNANTWDNSAPSSGWGVSGSARAGGIGVSNRGYYGHVVYIEEVSPDGKQIKYSDMNGLAGFGRVGHSGWVPVSKFDNYISR